MSNIIRPYAEVWVEFLPPERGGRSAPIALGEDAAGRYRPHFRIRGGSELLGVEFVDGPDDPVMPGAGTFATVRFLYPGVSYTELVEGAEFEVLEGPFVVATGRVTRR